MRTALRRIALLGLLVALAGCADDAPQDALDPAGPYAERLDDLITPIFGVAAIVFVVVQGLIVYAVWRFRRREDRDLDIPAQIHGNTRLEVGWTILPAVVLVVVSVFTIPVIFEATERPDAALEVSVMGQKYWWGYTYDAEDVGGDGAITTANELHIPAGRPIFLTMRSNDVIHSFWAPRLNGKRDVVPGREHNWALEADEPGVYAGQCAEFCGTSHANMRLKVVAHTPEDFDLWVADQQATPAVPAEDDPLYAGYQLFSQRGCAGCHVIDGVYDEVAEDSPSAPNLTHLFDRDCFAGCVYDLNDRNEMEAWLRNPQRKAGSLMVIAQLTEEDIDSLYAYLESLQ